MRGRKKAETTSRFVPFYRHFTAENSGEKTVITLETDELEALRLADISQLYHEECAAKLGVSRPTFSRILERARKKSAEHFVRATPLVLAPPSEEFRCAYPSNDRATIAPNALDAQFVVIAVISGRKIKSLAFEDNPKTREELALLLENVGIVFAAAGDQTLDNALSSDINLVKTARKTLDELL
ncbi:hypothetical protein FACS1894103_2340 [Campylobacterota bacterium]|nr:hypothetical protein FACS1894103_2340 [Campylobacterota bacterium]